MVTSESQVELAAAEIERLQAIWNVQSLLIHEMGQRLSEADRSEVYAIAREHASRQEVLRRSRPMQVIPYLGNVARDVWSDPRAEVIDALQDGPKSSDELGCDTGFLRAMEADGLVTIDPDAFPDEFVPGNPFIARLPGDERPWPHWSRFRR